MKRILAVLLAVVMVASLMGCNSATNVEGTHEHTTVDTSESEYDDTQSSKDEENTTDNLSGTMSSEEVESKGDEDVTVENTEADDSTEVTESGSNLADESTDGVKEKVENTTEAPEPTTEAEEPTTEYQKPTEAETDAPTEAPTQPATQAPVVNTTPVPTEPATEEPTEAETAVSDPNHTHNYTSTIKVGSCTEVGGVVWTCSCGDTYMTHVTLPSHGWNDWETIKAPTTTESGVAQRTCRVRDCGAVETKTIEPLSTHIHEYTSNRTTAATCSSEGVDTYTCLCGDSYTESVPKTNHTTAPMDLGTYVQPTCTEDGYIQYVCESCGQVFTTPMGMARGHSYSEYVVKPTCTREGYTEHTCCDCGHAYKDTITNKIDHTWGEWQVQIGATHHAPGTEIRHCTMGCGECETREIPQLVDSMASQESSETETNSN